jgi:hypothetical protein
MKTIHAIFVAAFLGMALGAGPVAAQPAPAPPPPAAAADTTMPVPDASPYPDCGSWQSGTWVPSGACGNADYRSHVAGTITSVKGHLVTLQQTTQSLVINDQPALDRQATGKVGVGRQIIANGYWRNGVFYASSLHTVGPS